MRSLGCFAFILVAAVSSRTYAADVVFGLEFGLPVTLAECAFHMVGAAKLYDQLPGATCVEDQHALNGYAAKVRTVVFGTSERPVIVKNWRAFLLEDSGNLIGVHFLTPGVDAQTVVLQQLTAKYGKPTTSDVRSVQNLSGARFAALSATWRTSTLVVTFEGVGPKLTYGEVFIDTTQADAIRKEWAKDTATKARPL